MALELINRQNWTFRGAYPMCVIIKVIDKSSKLVKKGGKLILEINFDQVNKVKKLLKKKGFYTNRVIKDLGKKNRCIVSTKL